MIGVANGQRDFFSISSSDQLVAKYVHFTPQQLLDTGYYHYFKNDLDEALLCFNLLMNTIPQSHDIEHQKLVILGYISSANIYYLTNNYSIAYSLLLTALQQTEAIDDTTNKSRALITLGLI
jgi:outer membrane protein assembly factor BamD (BamD/ComL family)